MPGHYGSMKPKGKKKIQDLDYQVSKNIYKSHNDGNFVFKSLFYVDISFWVKLKQCY